MLDLNFEQQSQMRLVDFVDRYVETRRGELKSLRAVELTLIRMALALPDVPIPLKKGDPDVVLSLRSVLATAYERAGYDLDIDYRRDPVPPFQGKDATWANRLLVEQGLRPKPVAE